MAEIIAPERHARAAGPGLSYWLGSKVVNAPLAMETSLATRLHGAIKDKAFDAQVALGIGGHPLASKFVGQRAGENGYRVTDDGIAVLPVAGVLIDRGAYLDLGGWMTTYEGLAEQCRRILKDDAIKAVILDIDSGGGMAAGLFDVCGELVKVRAKKRLYAVAANLAASAAYAIGCVADEMYVTRTGIAGSIGVITLHMSYADMMSQIGVEPTIIHAGAHKPNGNPYQALSHIARAEMSAQCDQLYADFVAHVAKERGLDADAVRATEARVYTGEKAVAAKLVDGVKSFEATLDHVRKALSAGGRPRGKATTTDSGSRTPTTTSATGDTGMSGITPAGEQPDLQALITAGLAQLRAQTQPAAAPAAASPPPVQQPASDASADAVARVFAILELPEAAGKQQAALTLAKNVKLSVDEVKDLLAMATADGGQPTAATQPTVGDALAREMAKSGNAAGVKPGASAPAAKRSFSQFCADTAKKKD